MRQKPLAVLTETNRSLNRVRYGLIASVVVLVLGLATLAVVVGSEIGRLEANLADAGSDRAAIRADLIEQSAALSKANTRLVDEGLKPVTPPVAGATGATGAAGQPGRPPTAREIRDAVDSYCADAACRGPAGDGVTRSQVALAVATYCDARGECRGAAGDDGSDGAAGPPGPAPSGPQIAAAVASFCADGRCRGDVGPPGPAGTDGKPGVDGVGIATVELRQTGVPTECDLIVTFTDATTQNAGRVTCPATP